MLTIDGHWSRPHVVYLLPTPGWIVQAKTPRRSSATMAAADAVIPLSVSMGSVNARLTRSTTRPPIPVIAKTRTPKRTSSLASASAKATSWLSRVNAPHLVLSVAALRTSSSMHPTQIIRLANARTLVPLSTSPTRYDRCSYMPHQKGEVISQLFAARHRVYPRSISEFVSRV